MQVTLISLSNPATRYPLDARYNETLENMLRKFNDFRAPDNQIKILYNRYKQTIPLNYHLTSDKIFYF